MDKLRSLLQCTVKLEISAQVDDYGEPELIVGLVRVFGREVVEAPGGLLCVGFQKGDPVSLQVG